MSAALQLTRLDGGGSLGDQTKESDRLAKIQEKNRKAQQKYAPLFPAELTCSFAIVIGCSEL